MMISEPVVQESAREWETWPDEDGADRGLVHWKTLLSADVTHSEALTMGIANIPPGEALHTHRHLQAEIYLILQGRVLVRIDGRPQPVAAGSALFIPANAPHSCENTGTTDLRFAYVFAANSFAEIEYIFEE
jgi:mannose-6-phosphate isomerase-like protein (cupin superfamily)